MTYNKRNKRKRVQTPSTNATPRSKILKALDSVDATQANKDPESFPSSNASQILQALDDAVNAVDDDPMPETITGDAVFDIATKNGTTIPDEASDAANEDKPSSVVEDETDRTDKSTAIETTASDHTPISTGSTSIEEDHPPGTPSCVERWSNTPEKIFNEINGYVNVDQQL